MVQAALSALSVLQQPVVRFLNLLPPAHLGLRVLTESAENLFAYGIETLGSPSDRLRLSWDRYPR